MNDIVGYVVKGRKGVGHWAALCEEWILATQRYARVVEGDASYWFNELADVAILSGAAWRCGWVAVTESQIVKGARHRPKRWGRADLYIGSDHHDEYIEAKHRSVSLNSRYDFSDIFDDGLCSALKDAKGTSGREQLNTIGVCFFSFFYAPRVVSDEAQVEQLIQDVIEKAQNDESHIIAWCFPERTRQLEGLNSKYWPGTLLLGENPKHSKRI